MNALGILYLTLGGVALVAAAVHIAQALIIRSDRTQAVMAVVCLGFGVLDFAIAFTSETTGSAQPAWWGWHLVGAVTVAVLTVVVPMVPWLVLELKLTGPRRAVLALALATGAARVAGVSLLLASSQPISWERMHSLQHPWLAGVSVLCPIIAASTWLVEGALARARHARFGGSLTVFGLMGLTSSFYGVGVAVGICPPPDLFGLLSLPTVGFIQMLSSVRFIDAVRNSHQGVGDIDRYQVLRKLSSGGMGDVFLARRRGPAGFLRDVVLKTLQAGGDLSSKERFLVEARVAAQLRHPNIVDVYDLGEQPGGFFIVMELISGVTLNEILKRARRLHKPIPPDVVAELGIQICRALSFAHAAGVLHRDIKRQNVMVSFAGVLKLIDFGIAQEMAKAMPEPVAPSAPGQSQGLTVGGSVVGTPGYIALERYEGQPASVASDLFSVGVVLYELLAQTPPFTGRTSEEFVNAIRRRAPALGELRHELPQPLAAAVEQCLEPDAPRRPASATSLQAMLEVALVGCRVDLALWLTSLFPNGAAVLDEETIPTAEGRTQVERPADLPTTPLRGPHA